MKRVSSASSDSTAFILRTLPTVASYHTGSQSDYRLLARTATRSEFHTPDRGGRILNSQSTVGRYVSDPQFPQMTITIQVIYRHVPCRHSLLEMNETFCILSQCRRTFLLTVLLKVLRNIEHDVNGNFITRFVWRFLNFNVRFFTISKINSQIQKYHLNPVSDSSILE